MKPAARHLSSVAQVGNLPFRRLAVGTAADRSRACGLPIRDTAGCQSALRSIARTRSDVRAFTMIEIAISIAVVAFALVAIMGVLPTGLNVQRDNREETIINQDAAYILQALRSGTTNLPLFLRNIDMI
ncbi:MAG: hypothetical protein HZA89_17755 [Verrucomicrobia bacterium]|nr:hypothetical protein [Verrucomicrobiota bacterium]